MIKIVYVKQNNTVWRLPISAWIGVCKDGARNAGYAFPDDCVVEEGSEAEPDSLTINIDNWMPVDFKDFIAAYERGDIKAPKAAPIVPKQEKTIAPAEPVKAENPKAKKPRAKK